MSRNKLQFREDLQEARENVSHYSGMLRSGSSDKFYSKNKTEIENQIKSLKSGPASRDKDGILDWINASIIALGALNYSDYLEEPGDADLQKAAKETKDIRNAINDWIDFCMGNEKKLFNENGEMDPSADGKEKYDILTDKIITLAANKVYESDGIELGKLGAELKDATKSTLHDSAEYKKIMTLLNKFKDGADFSNAPGKGAEEWRELAGNQKHALSLHLLKDAIEDYIDHKAADGVKAKDFSKLAAVEKLNQFVCGRLREINCGYPFEFNGKTYYGVPRLSYDEELKSAQKNSEVIKDTSVQNRIEIDSGVELKNTKYIKDIQNYSSCMDRIMLAKQQKLISENEKCTEQDLGNAIESLQMNRFKVLGKTIDFAKLSKMADDVHKYAESAKKGDLDSTSREEFTKIADTIKKLNTYPEDSVKALRDTLSVDIFKMAFKLQDKVSHPEGFAGQPEFEGVRGDMEKLFKHGNELEAARAQKEAGKNKAVKKDVKARGI